MRVQYYDVARLTGDAEDALGVRFALFPELLRSSDIVTLHVPLDASTHKLIGAQPGADEPDGDPDQYLPRPGGRRGRAL
jgi:phosphoglycerate dehydrogenase-like enzyme